MLLARILIQQTPVVLLDEPTAELDLVYENTVLGLSRQLARAGRSVVLSLHDIGQAARCCTGLFCWGREGCWPRGPPGTCLTEERLEAAYGVPFLVREQEGELTVRVRRDPDREAREEKWLEQILENREA